MENLTPRHAPLNTHTHTHIYTSNTHTIRRSAIFYIIESINQTQKYFKNLNIFLNWFKVELNKSKKNQHI